VRWSVVIPAFNEATRLPPYLEQIFEYFEGRGEPYEVLVVNDASTDATAEMLRTVAARQPALRVLTHDHNHGKGGAVRAGMLAATGDVRLFTDADGATPIAELKRLEPALAAGADVVIGSRALTDPAVSVRTRPHRLAAGRVFNWVVARLGLHGIADTQCGFKAFTATAATRLFGPLETQGFGFDVELLLRARSAGMRIVEVAVNWADQAGSKVSLLTTGPRMVVEIVRARRRIGRAR
jgi:dolichyl-phosphate beta-glucosyltransferase